MMSLVQGYSSDEDDMSTKPSEDAFGISSIPAQKKRRMEESAVTRVESSAPDVLAEVSKNLLFQLLDWMLSNATVPSKTNVLDRKALRHADERQHPLP